MELDFRFLPVIIIFGILEWYLITLLIRKSKCTFKDTHNIIPNTQKIQNQNSQNNSYENNNNPKYCFIHLKSIIRLSKKQSQPK